MKYRCCYYTVLLGGLVFAGCGDRPSVEVASTKRASTSSFTGTPYTNPLGFISQLDLECRRPLEPPAPPESRLRFRHLHPAFQALLPGWLRADLGPMGRTCWPVTKNMAVPDPDQRAFIEYVDIACYRAVTNTNPAEGSSITLEHLNPRYAALPDHSRALGALQSLCFPVLKVAGQTPPPPVLDFVRYFDLACYATSPDVLPDALSLDHLNPLLVGAPRRTVTLDDSQQVCVPIEKRGARPPAATREALRWSVLSPYELRYQNFNQVAALALAQLNPRFKNASIVAPRFSPVNRPELMLPMALNGIQPPGPSGNGPGCAPVVPDCIDFNNLPLGAWALNGPALPTPVNGVGVSLGSPTVGGVVLNPPLPQASIDNVWFTNPVPGVDQSVLVDPGVLVLDFSGICPVHVDFDYRYENLAFTPNLMVNGSVPLERWSDGTSEGTPPATWTVGIAGPGVITGVGSVQIDADPGGWIDELVIGGDFMRFDSICWQ